jgi:hypothetical protein
MSGLGVVYSLCHSNRGKLLYGWNMRQRETWPGWKEQGLAFGIFLDTGRCYRHRWLGFVGEGNTVTCNERSGIDKPAGIDDGISLFPWHTTLMLFPPRVVVPVAIARHLPGHEHHGAGAPESCWTGQSPLARLAGGALVTQARRRPRDAQTTPHIARQLIQSFGPRMLFLVSSRSLAGWGRCLRKRVVSREWTGKAVRRAQSLQLLTPNPRPPLSALMATNALPSSVRTC